MLTVLFLLLLSAVTGKVYKAGRLSWGERQAEAAEFNNSKGEAYYKLQAENVLIKAMDQRLKQLWEQRNRLISIHVHVPKAGGTALAYALASSCNCSAKNTLAKDSAHVCTDCRKVLMRHKSQPGWVRAPCTLSRVTGWPCGFAHAPLALLRLAPYCTGQHTVEQRGRPLFVVMLRDPWKRFVSEWSGWGGYRLNTLDWSAVSLADPNISFPFFNSSLVTFRRDVARPKMERATLEELVALPGDLMLHNRYTKMIGGGIDDFNFNFSRSVAGSRWASPWDSSNDLEMQRARALHLLQRSVNVLPLLQEKFAESLCILEVLMGSLQRFDWTDKKHSHGRDYKYSSSLQGSNLNKVVPDSVFRDWELKNAQDLQLYNDTVFIFQVQLQRALHFLREGIHSGLWKHETVAKHQPHCAALHDWKAMNK